MSAQVIPWSYSSLTSYENCGFRFAAERIHKTVQKKQYQEAANGIDIHKVIELHLTENKPLPDATVKAMVDTALRGREVKFMKFEHKLGVTKDLQPCDYYDKNDCYYRGILDVMYVNPENSTGAIFDWKNGKPNAYSEQLKANSALVFAHYPHITTVHNEYVWLRHKDTTPSKVFRDFYQPIWERFIKRVDRLQHALATDTWYKKPSGLCKKYCPVTHCEHNGEFKRG
jgi:hypothetical protein